VIYFTFIEFVCPGPASRIAAARLRGALSIPRSPRQPHRHNVLHPCCNRYRTTISFFWLPFLAAVASMRPLTSRGVAQPGRALPSGGRSRKFESCHPDQSLPVRSCGYKPDGSQHRPSKTPAASGRFAFRGFPHGNAPQDTATLQWRKPLLRQLHSRLSTPRG
jgi:hypothetical protein